MYSILIIEDDPTISSNIELILKMEGYSVRSAGDGRTGLKMIGEKRPDLILCDILMPDMDGQRVLEQLRSDPDHIDIPFIFVTALGDRSDVRQGMSAGADDYLVKPFSAEELIATVTGRLHRLEVIRKSGARAEFEKERTVLRQRISDRELQVLLMVGEGATSREISIRLGISMRTAEVHRSNLMKKLDAPNAAILARWAVIAEQL